MSETRYVEIEDIGKQGDGIARVERGYVIIVPGADVATASKSKSPKSNRISQSAKSSKRRSKDELFYRRPRDRPRAGRSTSGKKLPQKSKISDGRSKSVALAAVDEKDRARYRRARGSRKRTTRTRASEARRVSRETTRTARRTLPYRVLSIGNCLAELLRIVVETVADDDCVRASLEDCLAFAALSMPPP